MPLFAKIVASFGVIAALGLVGTGLFDGWVKTRRATAAGALSGVAPADAPGASASGAGTASASAAPPVASASASARAPCNVEGKVILNRASAEELDKLPGVGPSKALRIVELRERLGGFKRLEELFRIKGIKRRLLEKIRPLVVLDPPPGCSL
ncbi:MAG: helix-hairpin-helix domain-containing protein [Polyangiaceae bacterium]